MKKLVILTSLFAFSCAILISCCNQEPTTETTSEEKVCPVKDAVAMFNVKDSIAGLLTAAIADDTITMDEASAINNAFGELQTIDAENKTKYQDSIEARDKYFAILNAENNYNKALKLASEVGGYQSISTKVK